MSEAWAGPPRGGTRGRNTRLGRHPGVGHGDDPARRARLRRAMGGQGVRLRGSVGPAVGPEPRCHAPCHRSPASLRLPGRWVLRPVARWRGDDVREPPAATPNRPDYQPTAGGSIRQVDTPPRFAVGDRVRTRAHAHAGHTRLPRYSRGHVGTVAAVQSAQVLPDTHAHFVAENAQHVYAVAFDSTELWGDGAESFTLTIDLYDDYLEPV